MFDGDGYDALPPSLLFCGLGELEVADSDEETI
jgi:hypothetical protein